jgi:hypothetical protein
MSEGRTNTKAKREELRTVQVCVAFGLVIGIVFIIAGWLLKNHDTNTTYLPTTPNASETTGSGVKD